MGRPPKSSAVDYQEIEQTLHTVRQLAAPAYMPKHPELLGQVIIALTDRIRTLSPDEYLIWRLIDVPNPPDPDRLVTIIRVMLERINTIKTDEYNHCRTLIAKIAMLEAAPVPPDEKKHIVNWLHKLVDEPASTSMHAPHGITLQREILIDFLRSEQFLDAGNPKDWVKTRWDRIITLLTVIPCRCCYDTSHRHFLRTANRSNRVLRTITQTADTVLAALHNSTTEYIRKLIQPSV